MLSKLLKEAQRQAGLKDAEAAGIAHVSRATWQRWISGKSLPQAGAANWFLISVGMHPELKAVRKD